MNILFVLFVILNAFNLIEKFNCESVNKKVCKVCKVSHVCKDC